MRSALFTTAILLGCVGGLGWALGDLRLAAWSVAEWPTMKPSTAGMCVLCGVGGAMKRTSPQMTWACALATLVIVSMVVGGFAAGGELTGDTDIKTIAGGMPSWGTLAGFLIVGVDRLAVDEPPMRWVAGLVIAIGVVALVGYAVGAPWMYYFSPTYSTGMAVPTALAVMCIGGGMWLERKR